MKSQFNPHRKARRILTSCMVVFFFMYGVGTAHGLVPSVQETAYPAQSAPVGPGQPPAAQLSPEQMQELVAPIALYPDALVAQILAASAYPT